MRKSFHGYEQHANDHDGLVGSSEFSVLEGRAVPRANEAGYAGSLELRSRKSPGRRGASKQGRSTRVLPTAEVGRHLSERVRKLPRNVWPGNLQSSDDLRRVWGPFSPLPVLLSESISELAWQEKYFLLKEVFCDAVADGRQCLLKGQEARMNFKQFSSVLQTYPCIEQAYVRDLFSFIDCQRNDSIEEADFISGLLVSSPEAPHLRASPSSSRYPFARETKTVTERTSGLCPTALIRLQLIFLTFDTDRDAILSVNELCRLLGRLMTLLSNEHRSGRLGSTEASKEVMDSVIGNAFWDAASRNVPPSAPQNPLHSKPAGVYTASQRDDRQHNWQKQRKQQHTMMEKVSTSDTEFDGSNFGELLAPATKKLGEFMATSLKKIFGGGATDASYNARAEADRPHSTTRTMADGIVIEADKPYGKLQPSTTLLRPTVPNWNSTDSKVPTAAGKSLSGAINLQHTDGPAVRWDECHGLKTQRIPGQTVPSDAPVSNAGISYNIAPKKDKKGSTHEDVSLGSFPPRVLRPSPNVASLCALGSKELGAISTLPASVSSHTSQRRPALRDYSPVAPTDLSTNLLQGSGLHVQGGAQLHTPSAPKSPLLPQRATKAWTQEAMGETHDAFQFEEDAFDMALTTDVFTLHCSNDVEESPAFAGTTQNRPLESTNNFLSRSEPGAKSQPLVPPFLYQDTFEHGDMYGNIVPMGFHNSLSEKSTPGFISKKREKPSCFQFCTTPVHGSSIPLVGSDSFRGPSRFTQNSIKNSTTYGPKVLPCGGVGNEAGSQNLVYDNSALPTRYPSEYRPASGNRQRCNTYGMLRDPSSSRSPTAPHARERSNGMLKGPLPRNASNGNVSPQRVKPELCSGKNSTKLSPQQDDPLFCGSSAEHNAQRTSSELTGSQKECLMPLRLEKTEESSYVSHDQDTSSLGMPSSLDPDIDGHNSVLSSLKSWQPTYRSVCGSQSESEYTRREHQQRSEYTRQPVASSGDRLAYDGAGGKKRRDMFSVRRDAVHRAAPQQAGGYLSPVQSQRRSGKTFSAFENHSGSYVRKSACPPHMESTSRPFRKDPVSHRPPVLGSVAAEQLETWGQEKVLQGIAAALIIRYDIFGDRRGLSFSAFIEAVKHNDIPGTSMLFRTRIDMCSVILERRYHLYNNGSEKREEGRNSLVSPKYLDAGRERDQRCSPVINPPVVLSTSLVPVPGDGKPALLPSAATPEELLRGFSENSLYGSLAADFSPGSMPQHGIDATSKVPVLGGNQLYSGKPTVAQERSFVLETCTELSDSGKVKNGGYLLQSEIDAVSRTGGHSANVALLKDAAPLVKASPGSDPSRVITTEINKAIVCCNKGIVADQITPQQPLMEGPCTISVDNSNKYTRENGQPEVSISIKIAQGSSVSAQKPSTVYDCTSEKTPKSTDSVPSKHSTVRQRSKDLTSLRAEGASPCHSSPQEVRLLDQYTGDAIFSQDDFSPAQLLPRSVKEKHEDYALMFDANRYVSSPRMASVGQKIKATTEGRAESAVLEPPYRLGSVARVKKIDSFDEQDAIKCYFYENNDGAGVGSSPRRRVTEGAELLSTVIKKQCESDDEKRPPTQEDFLPLKLTDEEWPSTFVEIPDSFDVPTTNNSLSPVRLLQQLAEAHERNLRLARRVIAAVATLKFDGWRGPRGRKEYAALTSTPITDAFWQSSPLRLPGLEESPLYILQRKRSSTSSVKLLPFEVLLQLCNAVVDILRRESNIVTLKAPVTIVSATLVPPASKKTTSNGDLASLIPILSGAQHDCEDALIDANNDLCCSYRLNPLLKPLTEGCEGDGRWHSSKRTGPGGNQENVVLLGNIAFGTRNEECIEMIALLFAMKLLYPSTFTLLRGPFEDFFVSVAFGFAKECCDRYGPVDGRELHRRLFDVMEFLPLCASIETPTAATNTNSEGVDRILCMTGDVPRWSHMEAFERFRKTSGAGGTSVTPKLPIPSLLLHFVQQQQQHQRSNWLQHPGYGGHQHCSNKSSRSISTATATREEYAPPSPIINLYTPRPAVVRPCGAENVMGMVSQHEKTQPGSPTKGFWEDATELQHSVRATNAMQQKVLPDDVQKAAVLSHESFDEHSNSLPQGKGETCSAIEMVLFEIVWSKELMMAFNARTQCELVDFMNVDDEESSDHIRRTLFSSSFLHDVRFNRMSRSRVLRSLGYTQLIRLVPLESGGAESAYFPTLYQVRVEGTRREPLEDDNGAPYEMAATDKDPNGTGGNDGCLDGTSCRVQLSSRLPLGSCYSKKTDTLLQIVIQRDAGLVGGESRICDDGL